MICCHIMVRKNVSGATFEFGLRFTGLNRYPTHGFMMIAGFKTEGAFAFVVVARYQVIRDAAAEIIDRRFWTFMQINLFGI